MEVKSCGWSIIDSQGTLASCLLFKTKKAADQYKDAMNERHPEGEYQLAELFVGKDESWDQ